MNTVFTALTLINLAAAAPFTARSPILSQSKGFLLTAHVPDSSRDLSPSMEGFIIDPVHVGAGLNLATLSVRDDNLGYTPYYLNGTDEDAAAGTTSVLNDLGTTYAWGLRLPSSNTDNGDSPGEHWAEVDVGGGTRSVGFVAVGNGYPVLTGPAPGARYAACHRLVAYTGANATVVAVVYAGEDIPADCAPVDLVPVCTGFGGDGNGGFARATACLESLSGLSG